MMKSLGFVVCDARYVMISVVGGLGRELVESSWESPSTGWRSTGTESTMPVAYMVKNMRD